MTTVLTYGTFDLFHVGHVHILERAAALGDRLCVGVSSDAFNSIKGKRCVMPYDNRATIVQALRCVDEVFPENDWDQKRADIERCGADVLVMGVTGRESSTILATCAPSNTCHGPREFLPPISRKP